MWETSWFSLTWAAETRFPPDAFRWTDMSISIFSLSWSLDTFTTDLSCHFPTDFLTSFDKSFAIICGGRPPGHPTLTYSIGAPYV